MIRSKFLWLWETSPFLTSLKCMHTCTHTHTYIFIVFDYFSFHKFKQHIVLTFTLKSDNKILETTWEIIRKLYWREMPVRHRAYNTELHWPTQQEHRCVKTNSATGPTKLSPDWENKNEFLWMEWHGGMMIVSMQNIMVLNVGGGFFAVSLLHGKILTSIQT